MSERSKLRRKAREEKQEKQANRIISWIFGSLIVLGIIFVIVLTLQQA